MKTLMTREQKEQVLDEIIAHYEGLGATVVADEQSLCRLLATLELAQTDEALGEYLCSFLTT